MRFLRWLHATYNRFAPGAGSILPWVGGLLLLVAAVSGLVSWNAIRTKIRATATVTENVSVLSPHDGVLYSPRLRFRLPNGELFQVLAKEASDEAEFPAGSDVPVLYPAGHPEQAVIATVWRIYWVAILLGVFGVILFDAGLLLRILLRRRSARLATLEEGR